MLVRSQRRLALPSMSCTVVAVVAIVDDLVETVETVEPEVIDVGIPGKGPVSALVFRVDRTFGSVVQRCRRSCSAYALMTGISQSKFCSARRNDDHVVYCKREGATPASESRHNKCSLFNEWATAGLSDGQSSIS